MFCFFPVFVLFFPHFMSSLHNSAPRQSAPRAASAVLCSSVKSTKCRARGRKKKQQRHSEFFCDLARLFPGSTLRRKLAFVRNTVEVLEAHNHRLLAAECLRTGCERCVPTALFILRRLLFRVSQNTWSKGLRKQIGQSLLLLLIFMSCGITTVFSVRALW